MCKCPECGFGRWDEVCPNCGLVDDEYQNLDDRPSFYDFDDLKRQHGDARDHKVPNLAIMTTVNPNECYNTDLKRAIKKWDGAFGWNTQRVMILNKEMKIVCRRLGLDNIFLDDCYYYVRKYKDKIKLQGRSIESVAPSLVYLFLRLSKRPYSVFDFEQYGYEPRFIYHNYANLIKQNEVYMNIPPQNPEDFVAKIVDHIFSFNKFFADVTGDLILRAEIITYIKKFFVGIYRTINNASFTDIALNSIPTIGAILYLRAKNTSFKLTQKEVSDACHVSEVTLRKYIKKIKRWFETYEKVSQK